MADFTPGLELNAAFYADVVEPLIRPFRHSAALLGWGSDVLGYDTSRSTDHGWGPRLQIFVDNHDVSAVTQVLDDGLPATFRGWDVAYGWDDERVQHHVEVVDIGSWLAGQLGLDPRPVMRVVDWLVVPQQQLLGVVRGAVYADPDGELGSVREALAYYPDHVWRWILACQWQRLSQEEHFVGRTAEVGDQLGSQLVAGRLVRELMRLAFLIERTYWPYSKWFGTAFAALPVAADLHAPLEAAIAATGFPVRQEALVEAFELLARRHNELGLHEPLDARVRPFHNRPFRVLASERFAHACRAGIADGFLRQLPLVGSVDQFVDATDVLAQGRARRLVALYADERSTGPSRERPEN
ncbi:DUF4037 domain-containing protein [Phytoactinopolyspora alkaliphila]|uniref:DUF4037 domain-containing protein n=1 Tax=Phytoactinopolyspora alkaliphila TaxID=1783498 RepID=A0A6N9YNU0_9ACTN|nr:DUF4037 domain-containing protein [Phytoactinopolyspora alkaliphila]NED96600.1 DUF4037 domain-containing protein [Phytoactinopolyspora alkaliphila]